MSGATDPERYRLLRELFEAAQDLDPRAQRELLDRRAPDAELRADVERLLAADALEESSFATGAALAPAVPLGEPLEMPERIGRYRVLRRLGTGGMGTVFAAEQENPRRAVALKVLQASLLSPSMLRRFEYESEVLAQLSHPGIAHVYEAGTTEIGGLRLPYFAMELVDGEPITHYADAERLDVRARLELVARVADAVEHAHRMGVIHRDLKPANVLIDASGQPKILDFGIARAVQSADGGATQHTQSGLVVGTLAYMSPEQASGDPRALDTRSDVYALGVIAYELLTRRLPHDVTKVTLARAVQMIAEEDPARPGAVNRALVGDVETILLTALAKDKTRRYASAAHLAADVRAYLRHEPIAARPTSTLYQLQRFARRNRGLVAGLAATFVALVAGLVVSLDQARKSDAARIEAVAAGDREARARKRADSINDFVLKEMLAAPDPWTPAGKDVTVAETLDRIADRVATSFADDPELEADAHATLAASYFARGLVERCERHAERAVELRRALHRGDHADLAASLLLLARVRAERGDLDGGLAHGRLALEMYERLVDTPRSVRADANQYVGRILLSRGDHAAALERAQFVLDERRALFGPEHDTVAQAQADLLAVRYARGEYAEAERLGRENLALRRRIFGSDNPYVALSITDLTTMLYEKRDPSLEPEILALDTEAAEILTRRLGPEHRLALLARRSQANSLVRLERFAEAEPILKQVVETLPRVIGTEHEDYSQTLNSYGYLLFTMKRLDEAEVVLERALDAASKSFTRVSDNVLRPKVNLAFVLRDRGLANPRDDDGDGNLDAAPGSDLARAVELFRDGLATMDELYGPMHASSGSLLVTLGELMKVLGMHRESAAFFAQHVASLRKNQPAGWEQTITRSQMRQGLGLMRAGSLAEAEAPLREAADGARAVFGDGDWKTATCVSALGEGLVRLGRAAEAEPMLRDSLAVFEADPKRFASDLAETRRRLAEAYDALGRADDARALRGT